MSVWKSSPRLGLPLVGWDSCRAGWAEPHWERWTGWPLPGPAGPHSDDSTRGTPENSKSPPLSILFFRLATCWTGWPVGQGALGLLGTVLGLGMGDRPG